MAVLSLGIAYKRGENMTEKELRKLNRSELLEMLIAQSKKLMRVEKELESAKKQLEQREIAISDSGTLAEAALKLSGIFESADIAAKLYLDSIKAKNSENGSELNSEKSEKEQTLADDNT